jgi:hypothetical protein
MKNGEMFLWSKLGVLQIGHSTLKTLSSADYLAKAQTAIAPWWIAMGQGIELISMVEICMAIPP